MTIAELAAALRGIPRDTRLLIDTPDGLKDLRLVRGIHARAEQDGSVVANTKGGYAMVLYPDVRHLAPNGPGLRDETSHATVLR